MAGPLKNARQERFAQELAKGQSQVEAYRIAGYKPNETHASRLVRNGKVAERVAELKAKAAEKTTVTAADITQRLLKIAEKGEKDGGSAMLAVARASLMDVAKLNGWIVDKSTRELSPEQMAALMDMIRANPGLAAQMLSQMGLG
jgi:phage terminase small subunit